MRPESKELELEPAEPTPQAVVHQIFSNCIPETHVCKELLGEVLTQIGISKADADALLSVVNSGSSQVSYEDFVKFVFPPPKEQVVRRRRKMSKEVEEPFLISYFRRIFQKLVHRDDEGVTKKQLHEVLESFEMSLPGETAETADAVAHIFDEIDHNKDERICWDEFQKWLWRWNVQHDESEDAARSLFTFLDRNGDGTIDAQEMMDALMLLSDFECKNNHSSLAVTHAEAGQIIRDLDPDSSGGIEYHTFVEVLHASRKGHAHPSNERPHLVLNFDVNNTIVMLDSATGADSKGLIAMVLSNSAWGSIQYTDGLAVSWTCQHFELCTEQPKPGLQTYTEFVVLRNPFPDKKDFSEKTALRAANEKVKAQRRSDLWAFTDPGMPGEVFRHELEQMQEKLLLPEDVRGSNQAADAGLTSEAVQLLPSFLHFLRELKRQGRSFTLIFRTFGNDLPKLQKEIEALCQGWHPLFRKEDIVVLDGSDGLPDYRMQFGSVDSCGTFFRNPTADDHMALVMGSIEQPDSIEKGVEFWDDKEKVVTHEGVHQVFKHYTRLSSQKRTIALRDFYPGWAAVGSTSRGGKPVFLGRMDPGEHCIFFDDHIGPDDPHIVDPIDAHLWPRRFSSAQLFGVHLVRAQPLLSIRDRDYFVKCLEQCEAARMAKLERWRKLKCMVADLEGVRKVLSSFLYTAVPRQDATFRPWSGSRDVIRCQRVPTFAEEA